MRIEVWSDVVCPWCFIGKRRLDAALAATDTRAEIVHRAFQLDPHARTEGHRMVDHLAAKYGVDHAGAAAMMEQVTEAARSVGLQYRLAHTLTGNTLHAHRLVLWAQDRYGHDTAQALLERIMTAYFCSAEPIFEAADLLPHAVAAGIDADAARALLVSAELSEQVAVDQREASELGATGVPFFVIDRRFGIPGAQPAEVFERALLQAQGH